MSALSEPLLADMTPQNCPSGTHADWAVDSERGHACPWCHIAELETAARAAAGIFRQTAADAEAGVPPIPALFRQGAADLDRIAGERP